MITAVLFAAAGTSLGVVVAYATYPRAGVVHYVAAIVLSALAFAEALVGPLASPANSAALAGSLVLSTVLSSGLAWARHPLLADLGYWSRMRELLLRRRLLWQTADLVVDSKEPR